MKRLISASVYALTLVGCSDITDREGCIDESPGSVKLSVNNNAHGTVYPAGNVVIKGTAEADIRIDRLLVGDLDAKGERDNFSTWTIELTPSQLAEERGLAMLEVVAIDVCGVIHTADPVPVLVKAPDGTPAPGLQVFATPTQATSSESPECYLPADGSSEAAVTVIANEDAAGVEVTLSSAIEGELFGATEKKVVLERRDGPVCDALGGDPAPGACAAYTTVSFSPTKPGRVRLAAIAGPSSALDQSGLRAVGPPTFTGTSAAVPPQTSVRVHVETDGRLDRCFASSDQPGLVSVDADGVELTEDTVEYDDDQCGQREAFDVEFLDGAPVGLSVTIECFDTYQQEKTFSLLAGAPPAAPDAGG